MHYLRRILDHELDELMTGLPAVAIEGPKAVGKTATAIERAATIRRLDDPLELQISQAEPARLVQGRPPILIDEWQRLPQSWDLVRRAVDENPAPNRFILTGSASPLDPATHSGAGRIVRLRMRPLSLAERGLESPSVSLREILSGARLPISGSTRVALSEYAGEIVRSGFPAIRRLTGRALRIQLDSYLQRVVDRDFLEFGYVVRDPEILMRWLRAYAAATSTTASLETIRDAATSGEGAKPARSVILQYRSILERLWILDPVPAWMPSRNPIASLASPNKHHLADPALAASLLGMGRDALLEGGDGGPPRIRDGALLGRLFESLVTQSVQVYAQAAEASVRHLRVLNGRHEVDLILVRPDGRVVAVEVKLGGTVEDEDVKHLRWLQAKIGDDVIDSMVLTTGPHAYRRPDGIAVVPAALLGP